MSWLTFFVTSMENYKSLKICGKIDYGLASFQVGFDSIRPRSPHCCNSPLNELVKLHRISACYYGKYILIKSLNMLQLLKTVEL